MSPHENLLQEWGQALQCAMLSPILATGTGLVTWAETGSALGILERALAVVGGAVLGGFCMGLLLQLLLRLVSARVVPRWVLNTARLLGGIIAGWIVALLVFGSGGGGFGFGKGAGEGEGKGTGTSTSSAGQPTSQASTGRAVGDPSVFAVEVLDKKTAGSEKDYEEGRCFRVAGRKEILGPAELKNLVLAQQQQNSKLKVVEFHRLSADSPDRISPLLRGLEKWGEDHKITVRVLDD